MSRAVSMKIPLLVKFTGNEADYHKLPAYEAIESLRGIALSAMMITYYAQEGVVRHRKFEQKKFEFNLLTQRQGSFETLFELVVNPVTMEFFKGVLQNVTSEGLVSFIQSVYRRSIGLEAAPEIDDLEAEGKLNSGDIMALVDAIEPSIRGAHRSIDYGAQNVIIITGNNNTVNLNSVSKTYVNSSTVSEEIKAKLLSVGSFNANSGCGRVFDLEEGRTIPFEIATDADRLTVDAILKSLNSYARKRRLGDKLSSAAAIQYRPILSPDGKTKKIKILRARDDTNKLT